MSYADLYEKRCSEPCDINEHLSSFVDLVLELDAKKVIELGVRAGVSTTAWLYGVEQTDGHVWSVDVSSGPGFDERWTFIQGNDIEPEVLDQLPESVDIVFIDTSHLHDHTLRELACYFPKVRSGGRIVLHDTEVERPEEARAEEPPFPVKLAVEQFCDANGLRWSNREHNNGLAVIEVP